MLPPINRNAEGNVIVRYETNSANTCHIKFDFHNYIKTYLDVYDSANFRNILDNVDLDASVNLLIRNYLISFLLTDINKVYGEINYIFESAPVPNSESVDDFDIHLDIQDIHELDFVLQDGFGEIDDDDELINHLEEEIISAFGDLINQFVNVNSPELQHWLVNDTLPAWQF
jgi:hypothetical protein